ncbi:PfkB family carbohydrate kinase [Brachybacterium sp. AOP43-C2-M15]|uniref:PfkB family carbohydrate kinase n=1 Tax=Brachybacterium sp. AOP43-C2-M15 TaxID=3457661 RepID=UPI0040339B5C
MFAGLATLDVIHRVDAPPGPDEKVTARAQFVVAGGPAANAAVTFAALGGDATLLTALGQGPIASAIAAELGEHGVEVHDVAPELVDAAPVSSVSVLEATGERSVVGGDAAGLDAPAPEPAQVRDLLAAADVVLLDGHHPEIARAMLGGARAAGLPTVLDAGRWKPVMEELVGAVSDVVASADFRTPGATTSRVTAAELVARGATTVVTTAGPDPVHWWSGGADGAVEVPQVTAVDTLGAGDVFHGAYASALAAGLDVDRRIRFAAEVAAIRCAGVGPRSWLPAIAGMSPERTGPQRRAAPASANWVRWSSL